MKLRYPTIQFLIITVTQGRTVRLPMRLVPISGPAKDRLLPSGQLLLFTRFII